MPIIECPASRSRALLEIGPVRLLVLLSLIACGGAPRPIADVTTPRGVAQLDQHKDLIRRFYAEVWNNGHFDVADEVFSNDYTRHDPGGGAGPAGGPEGQKQIAAETREHVIRVALRTLGLD